MKHLLDKLLYQGVWLSCSISTLLLFTQIALAGYQPPPGQNSPRGNSDSSGTRVKHHLNIVLSDRPYAAPILPLHDDKL